MGTIIKQIRDSAGERIAGADCACFQRFRYGRILHGPFGLQGFGFVDEAVRRRAKRPDAACLAVALGVFRAAGDLAVVFAQAVRQIVGDADVGAHTVGVVAEDNVEDVGMAVEADHCENVERTTDINRSRCVYCEGLDSGCTKHARQTLMYELLAPISTSCVPPEVRCVKMPCDEPHR